MRAFQSWREDCGGCRLAISKYFSPKHELCHFLRSFLPSIGHHLQLHHLIDLSHVPAPSQTLPHNPLIIRTPANLPLPFHLAKHPNHAPYMRKLPLPLSRHIALPPRPDASKIVVDGHGAVDRDAFEVCCCEGMLDILYKLGEADVDGG
jgi:hypothetical protein